MASDNNTRSENFREAALFFHTYPTPGKLEIRATKALGNQRDLALAYSPGVAAPCEEIAADPSTAALYTARANLVGVITNGTAVLGLGAIGALASKPVMEGKAVLFKKFANVDVFDIEIDELDPDAFCKTVKSLEPTFGGINLEDIKAPECFIIEERLKREMNIPVFHDDQHGTAIIVSAAVQNALSVSGKKLEDVKIVTSGAGAAALACLNLLLTMGAKRENIWVNDIVGLVYEGRTEEMDPYKGAFAQKSDLRTLGEVIEGADVFLGLSAGGVLKPEMCKKMGKNPLILALANPNPEIMPELAKEARPDAIICTGRSDFPNQVNNVICFPYIFRGALDVGATAINDEMKKAAVKAIADLAHEPTSDVVSRAYGGKSTSFGADYVIPSPFDQRLILRIAPAVAKAAMESGVATRPIQDMEAYEEQLERFVFRSGLIMKPIIASAISNSERVIFSDGEDERVLRAAQVLLEDGIAMPILVGRPEVIQARAERFGLTVKPGSDFEIINPNEDVRYKDYVELAHEVLGRRGIAPDVAKRLVRTNPTVIAALAVKRGDADAMICGLEGRYETHLRYIRDIIGLGKGIIELSTVSMLIMNQGPYFFADSYITRNPTAEQVAETAIMAADQVRRFGLTPKVALLSYSNFGSRDGESPSKMRKAFHILRERVPDLEVDGEMQADAALSEEFRNHVMPNSLLKGQANLLVFPDLDSANLTLHSLKILGDGLHVGPILVGAASSAHILTPSVTTRGLVNMSAVAAVQAHAAKV